MPTNIQNQTFIMILFNVIGVLACSFHKDKTTHRQVHY